MSLRGLVWSCFWTLSNGLLQRAPFTSISQNISTLQKQLYTHFQLPSTDTHPMWENSSFFFFFFFFISRIFSTKSTEHQSEIQNMYLIPISEKSWEKMQGYPLGYAKSLSLSYGQSYHLDQFKTLEHQAFSIRFFELEWFRSPELHFDHFRLLVVWVGLKSAKMVVGSLHSTQRVSLPASLPFLQLFEKGEKTQHLVLSAMISIESNYTAADWNHQLNF